MCKNAWYDKYHANIETEKRNTRWNYQKSEKISTGWMVRSADFLWKGCPLADQVACIKAKTEDVIYKPDREEAIIRKQTEGMDTRLVREYTALIKRIMEVSRKYQYGRTMELRTAFRSRMKKRRIRRGNSAWSKRNCISAWIARKMMYSWQIPMRRWERWCEAAGRRRMGIIEEVGVGVSDAMHQLLLDKGLYINGCRVQMERSGAVMEKDGSGRQHPVRRKVITFSRQLVVLPEHNRIRIMFECPNRSGSLSSILSMISDYGVNLTEIHSRPFEEGDTWNYRFFAELSANMDTKEIRALLYQLSQETQELRILGSYRCEGDF